MGKTGQYQIPFCEGNQIHYPEYQRGKPYEMIDNFIFTGTLKYYEYRRGRSAAYFVFTRSAGEFVTVFLKDFEGMVPLMVNGLIAGEFTFTKRGRNYGCKLVGI